MVVQGICVQGILLLKDDFSHFWFVYFLKSKSEVLEKIKIFIILVEKQCGHPIKTFQSDCGTEFVNSEMKKLIGNAWYSSSSIDSVHTRAKWVYRV